MIRILIAFLLSVLSIQTYGQSKHKSIRNDSFIQQVEGVNILLEQYHTFSPLSEDEKQFDLIDSIGNEIADKLLILLNDKRILKYPIEFLFSVDELMISKSADNKVYFFSIDEKTGGSYRTSKTIIHYRPSKGMAKADLFDGHTPEALAASTYERIYLLDSTAQKYLVIGELKVCNTCNVCLALMLQLSADAVNTELVAQYDGRHYDLKTFEYDSVSKEFNYEFYAAENDDPLYGDDNTKPGFKHRHKSRFKYLNGAFVEIEKSEFWDNKE